MQLAPTATADQAPHSAQMLHAIRTLFTPRRGPDPFVAYARVVEELPLAAVPLAHALVHSSNGIHDDLRRWLDLALAQRAPTAIGQPSSRAVVSVWHALQDSQANGLQLSAEADWALLHAVGLELAALEAMRFLLRVHVVTVQLWLPGATEAAQALAASVVVWPDLASTEAL